MLPASPSKQLGAALLNELFAAALYLVEHVVPKVHKYLSWDVEDHDLGPILPEWSAPECYPVESSSARVCSTSPSAEAA
ncbi:hypothetical protein Gpo141_00007360 [Globisporangium polare]